ncbi:MAG: hypothetical protein COA73_13985 [Candidatus Hydrogenedentota bacterium]|nr:MAG: hypothetical protein COA73_13985 [Candidatus Hydrogenedentota bacterium]
MITPMDRVELVCLISVRHALVQHLQDKGLLHLEEVPLENDAAPEYLSRVALEGHDQERLLALEEGDRSLAETIPLLTQTPSAVDVKANTEKLDVLNDADLADKIGEWASQIREKTRTRVGIQENLDILQNYQAIIEQVAPSLGNDVKLGKGTRALVLTGDVARVAARLDERFAEEIGSGCTFHKNQTSKKQLVGLIAFPEDQESAVNKILNQEGVAPVEMGGDEYADATASEVLKRIRATISSQRDELGKLEGEVNVLSAQLGSNMLAAKGIITDRLACLRVQNQFAQSKMITVIHGWTPEDRFAELESVVEAAFPGKVDVNRIGLDDIPHSHVPTLLNNHKLLKPFEVVLSLFRPPTYGTVDPTWMVAISFIFFYGFILGDAVYGVGVIILSQFLRHKLGHIEAVNSAGIIGTYMGLSGIFFGVIYGEYAGNFVELWLWPRLFGDILHPIFHRSHETTQLLVYAIYMGIFHIFLGLALGIKEDFRHHHSKHAIEKIGMLLGLAAMVIQAFAYFGVNPFTASIFGPLSAVMAIAGVILIFYAMGAMGFIGIIEIMSLGGNVLSYARLMALGVASIALADIANDLPEMMGPVFGLIGAFTVHALNICIGIASPTIHSLRLNFVEFLPKFYAPEGKGFNPFKKESVS